MHHNELLSELDYNSFLDTEFEVDVILGHSTTTIKDFLNLKADDVITLNKMVGDGSDIYVNSRIVGKGEVIVFDENLVVRVKEVTNSDEVMTYFYEEAHL
jgi:flagellar motor switch protein FliN/FliY